MKDLDFDELDKAVNSLMANSQKENESAPPPTSPLPSSPAAPLVQASASVTPQSSSTPTSRQAPPAARRGGRFMDVVHPTAKKEATPSVSRQAPTLQPVTPTLATEVAAQPPSKAADVASVATKPDVSSMTTDWPDPLELVASKPENTVETEKATGEVSPSSSSETETTKSVETNELLVPNDEMPLSSPFLPDAKVEKRPLGGAALSNDSNVLMTEDENAQLPALPKDVEPALPEELHGDVVSIEADNSTTDPSKHVAEPLPHTAVEPSPAKKVDDKPKVSEPPKPAITATEAMPSGPTSISQQYKEEPSSGDQHSGAIYDTNSYHQPLSHPAKKKSGWSWVVWIILILLVGAAGGAALYLLGIAK